MQLGITCVSLSFVWSVLSIQCVVTPNSLLEEYGSFTMEMYAGMVGETEEVKDSSKEEEMFFVEAVNLFLLITITCTKQ